MSEPSEIVGQGEVRVTFVVHLTDPAAPRAEEIASGVELTFARDESTPPLVLPEPRRYEVATWPDGGKTVREVGLDGWPVVCGECERIFPTPEALVADYRQALEGMGLDDWGMSADQITACPHCAHDL